MGANRALKQLQIGCRHFSGQSATRRSGLGNHKCEVGWWREARPLEILRSNIPLREMGEKLDISISQAHRLNYRARLQQAA